MQFHEAGDCYMGDSWRFSLGVHSAATNIQTALGANSTHLEGMRGVLADDVDVTQQTVAGFRCLQQSHAQLQSVLCANQRHQQQELRLVQEKIDELRRKAE